MNDTVTIDQKTIMANIAFAEGCKSKWAMSYGDNCPEKTKLHLDRVKAEMEKYSFSSAAEAKTKYWEIEETIRRESNAN